MTRHGMWMALWALGTTAWASDLPARQVDRCVRAAVKVGSLGPDGDPTGTGSGTMIDGRGYILTNFHVVGSNETGQLNHPDGTVLVATPQSASEAARYAWVGKVVRAAPRLDLALVKITGARSGGGKLPKFPSLRISTRDVSVGSVVWTFGFPSGTRTVNVSKGIIAGLEMNFEDELSWLRTDAAINPGNSGGMMVDEHGQLVGVPTLVISADGQRVLNAINVARSVEQIPDEWLEDLRSGELYRYKQIGVTRLESNKPVIDLVRGNNVVLSHHRPRFYGLPRTGKAMVRTKPPYGLALVDLKEQSVLREGYGRVPVLDFDPVTTALAIRMPQDMEDSVHIAITVDTSTAPFAVPAFRSNQRMQVTPETFAAILRAEGEQALPLLSAALSSSQVPVYVVLTDTVLLSGTDGEDSPAQQAADTVKDAWRKTSSLPANALVMVLAVQDAQVGVSWDDPSFEVSAVRELIHTSTAQIGEESHPLRRADAFAAAFIQGAAALYGASTESEAPTTQVRGQIRDGVSGAPVEGAVMLIGRPDTPLLETFNAVRSGESTREALDEVVLAHALADSQGMVEVGGLSSGATYPVIVFQGGYNFRAGHITMPPSGPLELGVIDLMP